MINSVARNRALVAGVPNWKILTLAIMARALGVVFHLEGFPFGGRYRDSDGSGEAGETAKTGSTVGDSAGLQGIAPKSLESHPERGRE